MRLLVAALGMALVAAVVLVVIFGIPSKREALNVRESWLEDCGQPVLLRDMALAIDRARAEGESDIELCAGMMQIRCRQHLLELSVAEGCVSVTDADCLLGEHLFLAGDAPAAVEFLVSCVSRQQAVDALAYLRQCYEAMGEQEKATAVRIRLDRIKPKPEKGAWPAIPLL